VNGKYYVIQLLKGDATPAFHLSVKSLEDGRSFYLDVTNLHKILIGVTRLADYSPLLKLVTIVDD
jgi:hypothetical protein